MGVRDHFRNTNGNRTVSPCTSFIPNHMPQNMQPFNWPILFNNTLTLEHIRIDFFAEYSQTQNFKGKHKYLSIPNWTQKISNPG